MAASSDTRTESFSAVHQEILAATAPEATAPGKRPGMVHIQNHFIRKMPRMKIAMTQSTMAGSPRKIILLSFIVEVSRFQLNYNNTRLAI